MHTTEVFQKCAGGCGKERELPGNELSLWNLHGPLRWWCEPCGDRMVDEAAMKPLLDALEKHPHLRAKLREILEIE